MFLKNLDKLMAKKAINKSILAKESGIPYTTIDGFYKKGWDNVKLSTLLKLAAYFGVVGLPVNALNDLFFKVTGKYL